MKNSLQNSQLEVNHLIIVLKKKNSFIQLKKKYIHSKKNMNKKVLKKIKQPVII